MLAGAVNLQIQQVELQRSFRIRCVTKSEPKRGQTNRIPDKRDTRRRPQAGRKASSIATCPGPREKGGTRGAFRSSKIFTLPDLGMRLRQKESLAAPPGFQTPKPSPRGGAPALDTGGRR